jgi:hypothetical protein
MLNSIITFTVKYINLIDPSSNSVRQLVLILQGSSSLDWSYMWLHSVASPDQSHIRHICNMTDIIAVGTCNCYHTIWRTASELP